MAKFICLTQSCGNDQTKPLIINADHIQHIQIGNKGKDVHVRLVDGTYFFVKESFNEIKQLIAEPVRLPPAVFDYTERFTDPQYGTERDARSEAAQDRFFDGVRDRIV